MSKHGLQMIIAIFFLHLAVGFMPEPYHPKFLKHFESFKKELETLDVQ